MSKNSTQLPPPEKMLELMAKQAKSTLQQGRGQKLTPLIDDAEREAAIKKYQERQHTTIESETIPNIHEFEADQITLLNVDDIDEPFVKQRWHYSEDMINEMSISLLQEGNGDAIKGQLQPIIVIPCPDTNGRYEVVEGLTRLLAFKRNKLNSKIKAIVRPDLSREQAYRCGITSNEQRNQLSDYDKGMSYAAALEKKMYSNASDLANALGVSRQIMSAYLSFSKLDQDIISIIQLNPKPFSYNMAAKLASLSGKTNDLSIVSMAATKVSEGLWTYKKLGNFVNDVGTDKAIPKPLEKKKFKFADFAQVEVNKEGEILAKINTKMTKESRQKILDSLCDLLNNIEKQEKHSQTDIQDD